MNDMNLQELSLQAYGYEIYECPFCGCYYSEYEEHDCLYENYFIRGFNLEV